MKVEKELKVNAIKDGTVIDRIPSASLFKVISILGLENCQQQITFGMNLDSRQLGKKGIIKVSDRFFSTLDVNRIALVAPQAKLNVIKDYQVVEKYVVQLPQSIEHVLKCINPKCITNHEEIPTKFVVIKQAPIELRCCYCEKYTDQDNLQIK